MTEDRTTPWGGPPGSTSIDGLGLSTRAYNALLDHQEYVKDADDFYGHWERRPLDTVGKVRAKTDQELLRIPNFGRKSLVEVREACGDEYPYRRLEFLESLSAALHQARWIIRDAIGEEGFGPGMEQIVGDALHMADLLKTLADKVKEAPP